MNHLPSTYRIVHPIQTHGKYRNWIFPYKISNFQIFHATYLTFCHYLWTKNSTFFTPFYRLADLAKSCPDYPFVVTADCRCATAEALLSSGEIGCGSCPSRCDVCSTCLTFAGCGANDLARASKRGWSDTGGDIETREKKKHSLD